ncbi:MAG: hypothetical protein AB1938_20345 [Myxococcota bacterium]
MSSLPRKPTGSHAMWLAGAGLLVGLSACQSRSEFLLEKARRTIPASLDAGDGYHAAFVFEEVDARLRVERGAVDGQPAAVARAQLHALVAETLLRTWEAQGCLDTDREEAMLETVATGNAALKAKWTEKKEACAKAGDDARALRAAEALEKARGRLLLVLPERVDKVLEGCAAAALARASGERVVAVDAPTLAEWDELTGGEASAVSLGRALMRVEEHKVTRETRKMLTGELVDSEQVPVALEVSIEVAEKQRPSWRLEVGWATAESGRKDFEPLNISSRADLWPWLCTKLEAAAAAPRRAP